MTARCEPMRGYDAARMAVRCVTLGGQESGSPKQKSRKAAGRFPCVKERSKKALQLWVTHRTKSNDIRGGPKYRPAPWMRTVLSDEFDDDSWVCTGAKASGSSASRCGGTKLKPTVLPLSSFNSSDLLNDNNKTLCELCAGSRLAVQTTVAHNNRPKRPTSAASVSAGPSNHNSSAASSLEAPAAPCASSSPQPKKKRKHTKISLEHRVARIPPSEGTYMLLQAPTNGMISCITNSEQFSSSAPAQWCVDLFTASIGSARITSQVNHSHTLIGNELDEAKSKLQKDLAPIVTKMLYNWRMIQSYRKSLRHHSAQCASLQTHISQLERTYMHDLLQFLKPFATKA